MNPLKNRLIIEFLLGLFIAIFIKSATPQVVQASAAPVMQGPVIPEESKVPPELCNCYLFVRDYFPKLPRMAEISPNTVPSVGSVVILQYKEKHVGIVEKFSEKGVYIRETNYRPCEVTARLVTWNDPRLIGFWQPMTGG